ncbi:hypothetical protein OHN37_17360 [Streptomyces sp. NBC_00485]|uniref:hypothetical protein n=1 Tax=Streptomyces sp. NBC_00485 TaxID=2975758 RepID=UPI002E17029C
MFMRLCTPVSLCLAAAALVSVATPAHAAPGPACAAPDDRRFPLTSHIHGGPDAYEAGGGYGTWYLDVTNTTRRTCGDIHPVVVLVDDKRALKPAQPRLEFYDGGGHPHPVRFEATDEEELVGAFDDGSPGLTVGPGKTVTVKVRLALTADAVPNKVTVNAAVIQRHKDDGDWVGQSNDYPFRIQDDPTEAPSESPASSASSASSTSGISGTSSASPATSGSATPSPDRVPGLPFADELASTGLGTAGGLLAAAAVLLVTVGAVLLALRPRVRRRR